MPLAGFMRQTGVSMTRIDKQTKGGYSVVYYDITRREVEEVTGVEGHGADSSYRGVCTISEPRDQSVIFMKQIKEKDIEIISKLNNCLVVTQDKEKYSFDTITVENTRLAMAKILNYISSKLESHTKNISELSFVHPEAQIGNNVQIEAFAYIDQHVVIGDNVVICKGARILDNTIIGDNSIIRENSVVGGQGFGVEKDEQGNNLKISHLGGVRIGSNVEIGALNTIVSGTINPTTIDDFTKTDDHVHIAHNCVIGRNAIITAGVILSGSVTIGSNVWVGPNSTIKNSVKVNEDNLIGIGTVITKDIDGINLTYAGVPGKEFKDFIGDKKAMQYLVNNLDKIKLVIENENN